MQRYDLWYLELCGSNSLLWERPHEWAPVCPGGGSAGMSSDWAVSVQWYCTTWTCPGSCTVCHFLQPLSHFTENSLQFFQLFKKSLLKLWFPEPHRLFKCFKQHSPQELNCFSPDIPYSLYLQIEEYKSSFLLSEFQWQLIFRTRFARPTSH